MHGFPVYLEHANLNVYPGYDPDHLATPNTQLTIGDLHGNALKLLYFLVRHKVIEMNQSAYDHFVDIYNTPVENLTKNHLDPFNSILQHVKVNPVKMIRLMGDEFADRGRNDYFTLKIFEKLGKYNIPMEILLSNHGIEILGMDIKNKKFSAGILPERFRASLTGLEILVDKNLLTDDDLNDLDNILKNYYKPNIKALSYTVSESDSFDMMLYTHAPVGLETIESLAAEYKVDYDDSKADALCHTIDRINDAVSKNIIENKLFDTYLKIAGKMYLGVDEISPAFPLIRLIWNRIVAQRQYPLVLPARKNGYSLTGIHGHDSPRFNSRGEEILNVAESYFANMVNLDNVFGKGINSSIGTLHIYYAQNEKTASEYGLHNLSE